MNSTASSLLSAKHDIVNDIVIVIVILSCEAQPRLCIELHCSSGAAVTVRCDMNKSFEAAPSAGPADAVHRRGRKLPRVRGLPCCRCVVLATTKSWRPFAAFCSVRFSLSLALLLSRSLSCCSAVAVITNRTRTWYSYGCSPPTVTDIVCHPNTACLADLCRCCEAGEARFMHGSSATA